MLNEEEESIARGKWCTSRSSRKNLGRRKEIPDSVKRRACYPLVSCLRVRFKHRHGLSHATEGIERRFIAANIHVL